MTGLKKSIVALGFISLVACVQGYADSFNDNLIEYTHTNSDRNIDNWSHESSSAKKYIRVAFRSIDFRIEGEGLQNTAEIRFHEDATLSFDSYDAYYLEPFGSSYIGLFSKIDATKAQINSLPYDLEKRIEIPLDIITSTSGNYKLHWTATANIPDVWSIKLIDNVSDNEFDLASADSTQITLVAKAKQVIESSRFTIVVEAKPIISSITGTEGWRLLSSPIETKYDSLIGEIWTQGFTGSDSPSGASNVFIYDETILGSQDNGFTSLSNQSDTLRRTKGYAMYVYADDDNGTAGIQGGFPKTITYNGFTPTLDVEDISLGYTGDLGQADNGWNLIGNPFGKAIQVKDMGFAAEANLNNSVYVYRNGTYTALNANGANNADTIGVGEGFFVKVDAAVSYTFPVVSTAKKSAEIRFRSIDFKVEGEGLENTANIRFYEDAQYALDANDAFYLGSYNAKYLGLFISQDETALQVNSFPFSPEKIIEIPLHTESSESGTYTLSWGDGINIPLSWSIKLLDNETGNEFDLMKAGSLQFNMKGKTTSTQNHRHPVPVPKLKKITSTERFTIIVEQNITTSKEEEIDEIPTFGLEQNYPNPFNPTTSISYSVAKTGPVQIFIYNVMGRQVATLVNATKAVGNYQTEWNATRQASGIYYYRLTAPGQVITRQMTLIK